MLEVSKYESKQKAKSVTFYFSLSFVFLGIILLQTLLLTFSFIETPFLNQIQTFTFSLIVLIAEIIGFCLNSKHKEFTSEELDFLLQAENNIQLRTVDEMFQFARRNQTNILKQHKQAFKEICTNFGDNEYAVFTMLADEYSINNNPGPWHAAVGVTNKRFFICGETISGRMFTRYDMDCWNLEDIKYIKSENRHILINTSKEILKLTGENFDELFPKLEKVLKK